MRLLIKNIKGLVQVREKLDGPIAGAAMKELPILENAWLLTDHDRIVDYGQMSDIKDDQFSDAEKVDATGRFVFPSFVDSHTHIVFAEPREAEFVDRINGLSYEGIAERGGGILNSAKKLQETSEDGLFRSASQRLWEVIGMGTGCIEIKSGYGLTVADELKMLRVIRRLKQVSPIPIKSTFLGAHAIPKSFKDRRDYIKLVVDEMLPKVAEEGLADYIDVFCDKGFFTPEETSEIVKAGKKHGLKPRLHANELGLTGGVQVGVELGALSVDHLEYTSPAEIEALKSSNTMPTLLPGTAFFLKIPFPDARSMMDAGLPVALASDYNPGSCPSGNMPFVVSLGCIRLQMTPEEAINAVTVNTACAIEMQHEVGRIAKGLKANFFISKQMPSLAFLPYAFGSSLVEDVYINGRLAEHN